MATADISWLSPQDRARLARSIGVPIGDGRVLRYGNVVSSGDVQRSEADRARNAMFEQRTGARQPSPQFLAPAPQAPAPMSPDRAQPAQPAVAGAPSPLLLAQANQIQRYQENPGMAQQAPAQVPNTGIAVASGPGMTTAPTGFPQGSVGAQRRDGSYTIQNAQGGMQTFANEQAARTFYQFGANGGVQAPGPAIAPSPSPAFLPQQPNLADKTYTPQEISRMTPEQLLSREAFDQQNAARSQQDQKAQAELEKTKAETAALGRPKAENPSLGEQTVKALRKAKETELGRALNPQEEAAIFVQAQSTGSAAGDPEAKMRSDLMSKTFGGYIEGGQTARRLLPNISRLQTLLDTNVEDAVKTGKGRAFITDVKSVLQSAGLPVDERKLANEQEAQAYLTQSILEYFQSTKGAISNKENELFASMGPNFGKTNEANLAILGVAKKRLELDRDLERITQQGITKGTPFDEINAKINERIEKYDSDLDSLMPKKATQASAPAATDLAAAARAELERRRAASKK